MNMIGAGLKDLKIKDVLRPEKILKGDKEPIEKNFKTKGEVAKTGMSGFENRSPSRV
jgi:hypothetical protein